MSEEFVALRMAAAVTCLRLARQDGEGLLDVAASALSVWVPVYGGEPRARLRFRDGTPPIESLAILGCDLEAGIRRLERAGVRFSDAMIEPAPRRVPRVLPPTPER